MKHHKLVGNLLENVYFNNCTEWRQNRKDPRNFFRVLYWLPTKWYLKMDKCHKSVFSAFCDSGRWAQINLCHKHASFWTFTEFHQGQITAIKVFSCFCGCATKQNPFTILANANQNCQYSVSRRKRNYWSLCLSESMCEACCKVIWFSGSDLCVFQ